jgi:hypothetical protein
MSSVGGTSRPSLGGRQIDDEIKFGRLLDRDIARLGAFQNLVYERRVVPMPDMFVLLKHSRQTIFELWI